MTLSRPSSGESVGGSLDEHVEAGAGDGAGATSASCSASSSMRPPRATLTTNAVGFILANCSAPIMPVVSGVFGMWIVMKSDCASSSSRLTGVTPSCCARAEVT